MSKNAIFIAATGQNVGKSTLCLGIIAGLKKRFEKVGFIKPVGQQHVKVEPGLNVDKDVVLFKEHFQLESDYADMSPIILPAGFTRDYLEGKISEEKNREKIQNSFEKIYSEHQFTVVEGTGHVGVGSIVNMNNAAIAAQLGLDLILIASGGLGSANDELALNIEMCRSYGVKVQGIILNRVLDDKREMILDYFPRALKRWGIPLIGCVPYNYFLSTPSMKDFEILFESKLLSGVQHLMRHFTSSRLVAGSLETYQGEMTPNELIITPASRKDIIVETINNHKKNIENGIDFQAGMILTGQHPPSSDTLELISKCSIPILYAPVCSYNAMKLITSFTAKIRKEDLLKVEKAIKLVEENVNFEYFL
jgi:dethiobiotin synthase